MFYILMYGFVLLVYMAFTIESFDKSLDQMVVVYPDGSKEIKSYSAMLENDALYVK